ncbi:MAG: glycosyltransferase [Actinobacteria bacterium]|nr:glycosyltransferase [Actinomycetota bacterium]
MPRLIMLTLGPLDDDPRARRAARTAAASGIRVSAIEGAPQSRREARATLASAGFREIRGLVRLLRLSRRTAQILRAARGTSADIVHAHDFDTLPAAWLLARRHSARLVYDAHELYSGFDRDPPRLWRSLLLRIEGAICREAAAVVTVSEPIARALHERYRLPRRPFVVLNCPPLEEVSVGARHGAVRAIYQAAAGPGRNLADLPDAPGVEVFARVLGAEAPPAGVTSLPPVGLDELVAAAAEFDIGLVIDRPETENARLALPNKLFEYLMAGLAVAVPNAPAMAELVRREEVGIVYEPGELGEALSRVAADRPALDETRRRARAAAVERYNAEAQRPALHEAWGL